MAQLNDLLVMGQSTLLGPVNVNNSLSAAGLIAKNGTDLQLRGAAEGAESDSGDIIFADSTGAEISRLWSSSNTLMFRTRTDLSGKVGDTRYVAMAKSSNVDGTGTTYLRKDGEWATPTNTRNTAGSNASDETLYLTGVKSGDFKDTYGVTYCHASVYMTAGALTAKSFNASSDKRLKENLISFIPQKSILDLPIYKYDFINGVKNQIGCMAQDLQEICPEIVVEDENGYLSIQESKIVYLLIDEIKKLKEEINYLKQGG